VDGSWGANFTGDSFKRRVQRPLQKLVEYGSAEGGRRVR